jgi:endo-1,3(4)-beta-glucanase
MTDLESSSEDTFASYAIKMWGKATRDGNMEARGEYRDMLLNRCFANLLN